MAKLPTPDTATSEWFFNLADNSGNLDFQNGGFTVFGQPLLQMIADDNIDIFVDLNGHTSGGRLTVFARRAAPVQVPFIGYPDAEGVAEMDYRLSDAIAHSLAQDTARLAQHRSGLREQLRELRLCSTEAYVKAVEAAYEEMIA